MQKKLLTNSTPIYDKNSSESGHRGTHLNIIKAMCGKPTANIIHTNRLKDILCSWIGRINNVDSTKGKL